MLEEGRCRLLAFQGICFGVCGTKEWIILCSSQQPCKAPSLKYLHQLPYHLSTLQSKVFTCYHWLKCLRGPPQPIFAKDLVINTTKSTPVSTVQTHHVTPYSSVSELRPLSPSHLHWDPFCNIQNQLHVCIVVVIWASWNRNVMICHFDIF